MQVRGGSEPGSLNTFEKVCYVLWLHHIIATFLNTLHIFKLQISVDLSVDILDGTRLNVFLGEPTIVEFEIVEHLSELLMELVRFLSKLLHPILEFTG